MRAGSRRPARVARGFTLIWLLAAVVVLGIGMATVGPLWARAAQREREAALIRVGSAYAKAIEHYVAMTPGRAKTLPRGVDDLLRDPRFEAPVRHLREAYDDPMNPGQPLEPVRAPGGELLGVRSASTLAPLRQAPWTDGTHSIAPAAQIRDWQFLAHLTP